MDKRLTSLAEVPTADFSPQMTRSQSKKLPKHEEESSVHQEARLEDSSEARTLAQFMMSGNMKEAGKLLKSKYLAAIESYSGEKNDDDLPHGQGEMVFLNGDIYRGAFV
jgi:hypothetical protein